MRSVPETGTPVKIEAGWTGAAVDAQLLTNPPYELANLERGKFKTKQTELGI